MTEPNKEAILPARKKSKSSKPRKVYQFQPHNTLAYNPTNRDPIQHQRHQTVGQVASTNRHDFTANGNLRNNALNHSGHIDHTVAEIVQPDALPKRVAFGLTQASGSEPQLRSEQQSSDDSFDGVRWRPSTKHNPSVKPILSSPLKTMEPISVMEPATFDNEVTDSMLSKYGVEISNTPSQTPRYSRAHSDVALASWSTSPTLTRSRSFDPRSLREAAKKETGQQTASKLESWMAKLGDAPALKGPENHDTEESDDMSSEDDSMLASLKIQSFGPQQQIPEQDPAPDMDPFSDDLDLAALEKITQPSTVTSTVPSNTCTDEEKKSGEAKTNTEAAENEDDLLSETEEESPAKISFTRPEFTRYQITKLLQTDYTSQSSTRKQLILSVIDQNNNRTRLIVRGEASELDIKASDIIHVIHTSPDNPKLIDNSNNILILHPDTLISSTTIADQLFCPRRTVLSRRLAPPGEVSIPATVGTIVHEIFQLCGVTGDYSPKFIRNLVDVEINRRLLSLYSLGDVVEDVKKLVSKLAPTVWRWFNTFYKRSPSEIPTNLNRQKILFSVEEILDVEENIWSPMFGIKGIADVSLKATLQGESADGQFLLPLEIKTGKPHISHQVQSSLYSLLFKDRYNIDVSSFLIAYISQDPATIKHDISPLDLRSLINLRNRISVFLHGESKALPDLVRQQQCERCFVQESCMTFNYLTENGTAENSGLDEDVYEELTDHLQGREDYQKFLDFWNDLITKEEEFASRFNKDLWVLTALERENTQGTTLADVVIRQEPEMCDGSDAFIYTFERKSSSDALPMNSGKIVKHDKIIISDQAGHFNLATGYVREVSHDAIRIATKRRIITTNSKGDKFHRAGVLRNTQTSSQAKLELILFRLDKDEFGYGMGLARFNILNLFLRSGDHKRRKLIVDHDSPRYLPKPLFDIKYDDHFNESQVNVFRKVSKTLDYSLILGMPGTGKTTVIAQLITMLAKAGKSVLLTSYTNSAVDNILLKVKELDVDFIRLGKESRIHPDIKPYLSGGEYKPVSDYQDYKRTHLDPLIVASTCLGISDPLFSARQSFDYCIVDEASQVSLPICLGPLALCDRFILVGDHHQLPPLVTHPSPRVKAELSKSLFSLLATRHPESVVELTSQYRMCEDIMHICNKLVYEDKLTCGNEDVKNRSLSVPEQKNLLRYLVSESKSMSEEAWLDHAMNSHNKVIFFNYDLIPGFERSVGDRVTNHIDLELVRQTVEGLCACGVDPGAIGVMTLYRSQLKLLHETFTHIPKLEILTADRFQGRDKECIIISMVRSNAQRNPGNLVKDWRRVNVAVTRAKSKLIVFGSLATLSQAESIRDFISVAERKAWVYDLPTDALAIYKFPKIVHESNNSKLAKTSLSQKLIGSHPLVREIMTDIGPAKT